MIRIAQDRVEVDHSVKRSAGPDPLIYRLPNYFLDFGVIARNDYTFKGADRRANYLDAVSVSAGNQLAVGGNQFLGSADIGWIGKVAAAQFRAGKTNVIETFEQHNVSYAR